jgi:two-component system nitrogen regulation sensor histidine kinase NtrY
MIAVATRIGDEQATPSRWAITPAVELAALGVAAVIGIASYFVLTSNGLAGRLVPPPLIALLLIANIVPGVVILMLIGRRIARRRAALSPIGGRGQLHVRLVAIFSVLSAVPMLLVTLVASLLFQYGIEFWYSGQARTVFDNAIVLTRQSYNLILDGYEKDVFAMAGDLSQEIAQAPRTHGDLPTQVRSRSFNQYYRAQVYFRNLSESALFAIRSDGKVEVLATVNPYDADLPSLIAPALRDALASLRKGQRSAVKVTNDRIRVFTRLPASDQLFVYAARVTDQRTMRSQFLLATQASNSYHKLITRARALQLRFNAGLLGISLLIVGIAVWIALAIADRLVRPVGELVAAARRVGEGDLTARVPDPRSPDEVGTLAKAFNQMTDRLQQQNGQLTSANTTLENRRALIEAVMAGVSAGVVAIAPDGTVRIANASAARLLGSGETPVGRPLADIAPELAALIDDAAREAVVQVRGGERTLAVRIARTDAGPILTFDDITQQVLDQRRAAWADVARRIAHEIKNPLTPIQLAAERLQRRYGGSVEAGDTTFARLTETIVRQVGDLRRMVDEFSSFARMPKPVFRPEALVDTARQALFLHEVAHPGIRFALVHDEPGPTLVCDRRQIGQALTNIVKNAVEAIEARGEAEGAVTMTLAQVDARYVTVAVADTGIGLPAERDRIVEPYMTTRARGTGLGLAIVKKIVEEHLGTMTFSDRDGGGAVVTMTFDAASLAAAEQGAPASEPAGDAQLADSTPIRT